MTSNIARTAGRSHTYWSGSEGDRIVPLVGIPLVDLAAAQLRIASSTSRWRSGVGSSRTVQPERADRKVVRHLSFTRRIESDDLSQRFDRCAWRELQPTPGLQVPHRRDIRGHSPSFPTRVANMLDEQRVPPMPTPLRSLFSLRFIVARPWAFLPLPPATTAARTSSRVSMPSGAVNRSSSCSRVSAPALRCRGSWGVKGCSPYLGGDPILTLTGPGH